MAVDDPTTCPLGDWIHRQVDKSPDRPALRFGDKAFSYVSLADRIDRLTLGLSRQFELKPGDRIAYLGRNHPDLLVLIFAAARLGVIVVPLNWRLALPEHKAILDDAEPAVLLIESPFLNEAESLAKSPRSWRPLTLDVTRYDWPHFDALLEERDPVTAVGRADRAYDSLLIMYTSGTTGQAKGAVLTQDALRWNAANSIDMHDLNSDDRIVTALPLFHVGGLNIQTLPALGVGAEVILEARFDPGTMLSLIAEARPTLTVLVPTMMKALIDHPGFATTDLGCFRQITTGSSLVPISLIEAFHDRGVPVTQVYGTTETAPIAVYQRRSEAVSTIGSTGKAARHGRMRLVDEEGQTLGTGVSGAIQISGPQLMSGYWNNLAATSEAFDDRWFRTGDVGHIDEGGGLWVEAREDDLIKSGSERIYPAEIEGLLQSVAGVEEVIVVGRADAKWGEVPVAVVQPAAGADLDSDRLLQHLDGKIARFKWPKEVRFVEDLPRSALGKVLRYRLREQLDQE